MEITKQDWKLFREHLPKWQERYMDRLNQEYIELLSSDREASEKFWALEKRIRRDKKKAGVQLELSKSILHLHLAELLSEGAISEEDLDGFSEDLISAVKFITEYE